MAVGALPAAGTALGTHVLGARGVVAVARVSQTGDAGSTVAGLGAVRPVGIGLVALCAKKRGNEVVKKISFRFGAICPSIVQLITK